MTARPIRTAPRGRAEQHADEAVDDAEQRRAHRDAAGDDADRRADEQDAEQDQRAPGPGRWARGQRAAEGGAAAKSQ